MDRTLLCDISHYQDNDFTPVKPELGHLKDAGIQGAILRCSENLYYDHLFEYYWGESITHNFPAMVYGFLDYWPGSADAGAQGKFLVSAFTNKTKTRAWCDFERPSMSFPILPPRQNCLDMIHNWMDQTDAGMGMESGLYTNLFTIAYLSPLPSWLINRPFWLAWPIIKSGVDIIQYTRNMTELPTIPFTNRKLWQFTWTGPGIIAGMESAGLDLDWFEGTMEDLEVFLGKELPSPTPPPQPDIKQQLIVLLDEVATLVEQLP
jgi:GH25 family lysozyme M1 (1,4-beta-N-acetylmuramidase)